MQVRRSTLSRDMFAAVRDLIRLFEGFFSPRTNDCQPSDSERCAVSRVVDCARWCRGSPLAVADVRTPGHRRDAWQEWERLGVHQRAHAAHRSVLAKLPGRDGYHRYRRTVRTNLPRHRTGHDDPATGEAHVRHRRSGGTPGERPDGATPDSGRRWASASASDSTVSALALRSTNDGLGTPAPHRCGAGRPADHRGGRARGRPRPRWRSLRGGPGGRVHPRRRHLGDGDARDGGLPGVGTARTRAGRRGVPPPRSGAAHHDGLPRTGRDGARHASPAALDLRCGPGSRRRAHPGAVPAAAGAAPSASSRRVPVAGAGRRWGGGVGRPHRPDPAGTALRLAGGGGVPVHRTDRPTRRLCR